MSTTSGHVPDAKSSFFGGLSVSSVASDEKSESMSEIGAIQSHLELYQRLHDLEELTGNFLTNRPTVLTQNSFSFSEVERGHMQAFEFTLPSFSQADVLTVSITCIPDCFDNRTIYDRLHAVQHQPLDITMSPASVLEEHSKFADQQRSPARASTTYTPQLNNGEYSFTLTSAQGLSARTYVLRIAHADAASSSKIYQSIRVNYRVHSQIHATPLMEASSVLGKVGMNEFVYYRFTNTHARKVIRFKIVMKGGTNNENSDLGDADLYISNNHGGLIGVTKDNYTWKSTHVGNCHVDIHPSDPELPRGQNFVIGVCGFREQNSFELTVSTHDPPPIRDLSARNETLDVTIVPGKYTFYKLQINPGDKLRLVLSLEPTDSYAVGMRIEEVLKCTETSRGNAVYTTDSLFGCGAFYRPIGDSNGCDHNVVYSASSDITKLVKPSPALEHLVYPVVYVSNESCMFPTEDNFTWRASGIDGAAYVVFESSEFQYTSGTVYLSTFGVDVSPLMQKNQTRLHRFASQRKESLKRMQMQFQHGDMSVDLSNLDHSIMEDDSGDFTAKPLSCRLQLRAVPETGSMLPEMTARCSVYNRLFKDIDGTSLSYRDRNKLVTENASYTYAEIDFHAFHQMLAECDVSHGGTFADLGCGCGKAIVAAMFSAVGFSKYIGIEILTSLCEETKRVVSRARLAIAGNTTGQGSTGGLGVGLGFSLTVEESSAMAGLRVHASQHTADIREGDFLLDDVWLDADLVFLSSITYTDELLVDFFRMAASMRKGAVVLTYKLPPEHIYTEYFDLKTAGWYMASWGRTRAFVLKKKW